MRKLLALCCLLVLTGLADAQPSSRTYGSGLFRPNFGAAFSKAATTTSSSQTLTGNDINNVELYVFNAGSDLAFIRWGVGAQTAATTDVPVPAGTVQIFTKGQADTIAVRTNTTTATVYFITGEGR